MNRHCLFKRGAVVLLLFFTQLAVAIGVDNAPQKITTTEKKAQYSAIEYLHFMQQAYREKNYEMLYLNSSQNQLEPMQLIHGVVDEKEVAYFRYLNGTIRESLQYAGKISYFEQGSPAYTLTTRHNRSVFASIANFDYEKGKTSYEYVILGKGRIAGKQAIAIRMISKDNYRYSYVIWCDFSSYLPLRLDKLNQSNAVLEQVMVVSLNIAEEVNPWLVQLTEKKLPEIVHIPESTIDNSSLWQVTWLPEGFVIIKDDQHRLMMHENESVSYIMLDDGIVTVSIYISDKKLALDPKQKHIQRGATLLYTEQRGDLEINVVGDIPATTAKKLIESLEH